MLWLSTQPAARTGQRLLMHGLPNHFMLHAQASTRCSADLGEGGGGTGGGGKGDAGGGLGGGGLGGGNVFRFTCAGLQALLTLERTAASRAVTATSQQMTSSTGVGTGCLAASCTHLSCSAAAWLPAL